MMAAAAYLIADLNTKGMFPNQAGDVATLTTLFATQVKSYPDYEWTVDPTPKSPEEAVDIFMLYRTREVYSRSKTSEKKSESKTTQETSKYAKEMSDILARSAALSQVVSDRPEFDEMRLRRGRRLRRVYSSDDD